MKSPEITTCSKLQEPKIKYGYQIKMKVAFQKII